MVKTSEKNWSLTFCVRALVQVVTKCVREWELSSFQLISIALTLLLFGLYPVVNLVYAVQIQELKQKCKSMTSNVSQFAKLKKFQLPKTQTTATTGTDAV